MYGTWTWKITNPPPIVIRQKLINAKSLFTTLKSLAKKVIKIKCQTTNNNEKIIIKTENIADYESILKYAKSNCFEFHTYEIKEELPIKVLLKGLHSSTITEVIKDELIELGFKPLEIIQLKVKGTGIKIPVFILKYPPKTSVENIFKIKRLC